MFAREVHELQRMKSWLESAGAPYRQALDLLQRYANGGIFGPEDLQAEIIPMFCVLREQYARPGNPDPAGMRELHVACWLYGPVPTRIGPRRLLAFVGDMLNQPPLPDDYPVDPPAFRPRSQAESISPDRLAFFDPKTGTTTPWISEDSGEVTAEDVQDALAAEALAVDSGEVAADDAAEDLATEDDAEVLATEALTD